MSGQQKDGRKRKGPTGHNLHSASRTTTTTCTGGSPGQSLGPLHRIIPLGEQGVTRVLPGHTPSLPPEPGFPGSGSRGGPRRIRRRAEDSKEPKMGKVRRHKDPRPDTPPPYRAVISVRAPPGTADRRPVRAPRPLLCRPIARTPAAAAAETLGETLTTEKA